MNMRHIPAIFLLYCLISIDSNAQCIPRVFNPNNPADTTTSGPPLVLDIKTDFCAQGDNITDDHIAFVRASNFIRARGGFCILNIPAGTYKVGKQDYDSNGYYAYGESVLNIANCHNVQITGLGSPKLLFRDSLRFGYFDPTTGLPFTPVTTTEINNKNLQAYNGIGINVQNAHNITISNLVLDGNCYENKVIKGGYPASTGGIQLTHVGIRILNSGNVSIDGVLINNFGLDGIYLLNDPDNSGQKNVQINNSYFDYNGRQGISLVGGDSVFITHSYFTNTRQGYVQASPGAGVDMEMENNHAIKDIFFDNCLFENNFIGLNFSGIPTIDNGNIQVKNTTIAASSSRLYTYAIQLRQFKKLLFEDCDIYGVIWDLGNTNIVQSSDGVTFRKCNFSDCYRNKQIWIPVDLGPWTYRECYKVTDTMAHNPDNLYLYKGTRLAYLTIDSSTFEVYQRSRKVWNLVAQPGKASTISNSVIRQMPYINAQPVLIDSSITLKNNYYYYSSGQPVSHVNTAWQGYNTTVYWSTNVPPPTCIADTIPCIIISSALLDTLAKQADNASEVKMSSINCTVYPNPAAHHQFMINNKSGYPTDFKLYNLKGELLDAGEIQMYSSKNLSYSQLANGIYLLRISNRENAKMLKIVLQ